LGLARGQLRCLLAGEATTFVGLALLVGLPLGVVAGRLAWTLAADGLGTEGGPAVPVVTVGAAVGAVNLYAQGRATAVARRWPGADLRTE
jgi:H+/Cl- antiporter ClcA